MPCFAVRESGLAGSAHLGGDARSCLAEMRGCAIDGE